jgi:hypothetical protein
VEEDCMAYMEIFKRLQGLTGGLLLAVMASLILAFLMADFTAGLLPALLIILGASVSLAYIFRLRKGPLSYNLSHWEFTGLWIIIVPGGLLIYWCIGKIPGLDFEFDFWYILTVLVIPPTLFSLLMLAADRFLKGRGDCPPPSASSEGSSDDSPGMHSAR